MECKYNSNFQNRYNKAVIKAEEIIKNGELGDLYYASLSLDWCRPQRYYEQADWRGKWLTDKVSTNQVFITLILQDTY